MNDVVEMNIFVIFRFIFNRNKDKTQNSRGATVPDREHHDISKNY